MGRTLSLLLLLAAVAAAASFVWLSGADLPPNVASHFDASGRANGFSPRDIYVRFMTGMTVVAPLLVGLIPRFAISRANARINLPNGAYWLAPERREETIGFLCSHMAFFGMMLAGFLAYGHWMVVQANAVRPPVLPGTAFIQALTVFLGGVAVMILSLFWRFRRKPD